MFYLNKKVSASCHNPFERPLSMVWAMYFWILFKLLIFGLLHTCLSLLVFFSWRFLKRTILVRVKLTFSIAETDTKKMASSLQKLISC